MSTRHSRAQRCHTYGYVGTKNTALTNYVGTFVFPSTFDETDPQQYYEDPNDHHITITPHDVGLDMVDPTDIQGVRVIKNLYMQVVHKDNSFNPVHKVGLLLRYNFDQGYYPFQYFKYTDDYINNDETIRNMIAHDDFSGLTFATPSTVIASVNLGVGQNDVITQNIPGPITLESGDRLIFVVLNIMPIGVFSISEGTITSTGVTLNFDCSVTLDYSISY